MIEDKELCWHTENIMEARGWAVVHKGQIQVRTVSLDRRGAILNWLFIGPMGRVFTPMDYVSNDQIERWWAEAIEHTIDLRCLEVTITTDLRCLEVTITT